MACHWGPVLWHLLTDPSGSLQAPTACCDGQFLLASALEWPPGFRGHHQPPDQTRALRLISTCPHTSYYLDHDDVALKNFATCFLHQSYKEREHARNWWSCKNQEGGQIFHQHIKKPVWDHQESELNAMECTFAGLQQPAHPASHPIPPCLSQPLLLPPANPCGFFFPNFKLFVLYWGRAN